MDKKYNNYPIFNLLSLAGAFYENREALRKLSDILSRRVPDPRGLGFGSGQGTAKTGIGKRIRGKLFQIKPGP